VAFRLLQLAERDPKSPKPYEALAAFSLGKGRDRRQAETYWEQAVERGSTSAYVYLQLAKAQLRPIMRNPSLDYRIPPVVCESMRKQLDRAIELRSNYMDAWDTLALVEAFSEEPRASVVNQFKSVLPLMRSKSNTLVSLAIIAWRQGDLETCRSILGMVEKAKPGPTAYNLARMLNKKLGQAAEKQPMAEPEDDALKPIDRP
jgi:tetratricopeptide (TPR) repeat protein